MQVFIFDVHHFGAYSEYRPFRGRLYFLAEERLEAITVMLKEELEDANQCAFDLFAGLKSLFQCIRFMLESCRGVLAPPSLRSLESTPFQTHLNLSLLSLMLQFILNIIIYNDN